jgi:hypothetical protein
MPTPFLLNGILASQISGHLYSGPAGAFDALGSVTVGSGGQSSITFSAIPQTYTHLQIRWLGRAASNTYGETNFQINFNGDTTTSDYYMHFLAGDGSSASAGNQTGTAFGNWGFMTTNDRSSNLFATGVFDLLDYTSTTKNKTIRHLVGYDVNGAGKVALWSGLWSATPAAVNNITITAGSGTIQQNSQFSLYGIR